MIAITIGIITNTHGINALIATSTAVDACGSGWCAGTPARVDCRGR